MLRNLVAVLVLACLLTVCVTGCAGPDGDPGSQRLILANVHVAGYPTARGLETFAQAVADDPALAGVEVELQLGGVLGNEKEALEKLGFGGVQMVASSVAPLAEFTDIIGVLTLPYLFRDPEHFWTVLDGPLGDELLASVEPAGFVALAWYDAGARSFYNRERPVVRLADLEGLQIRVQKSEVMRQMVEALGARPVALGFKDVYTNLHTGAIDGAENNLPSYRSERHFEVATHYSLDRHTMVPDVLLINRQVFDGLSGEQQEALRRAARASSEAQRGFWSETEAEARAAVEAAGSTITEVEDIEAFQQAVEPLYAEHGARWGDLVARIRAQGAEGAEEAGTP